MCVVHSLMETLVTHNQSLDLHDHNNDKEYVRTCSECVASFCSGNSECSKSCRA